MITGPIIAEIAALVGDPARATMVSALLDGRAQTASELASAARITPQTASTHLAKLTEAGLLSPVREGRHRDFRLASPKVVEMLDGIMAVALENRPRYRPLSRRARELSAARICYDHLAGRLPGLRVESNRSVFDPERSPNRMQERAECERDRTLLRVELEGDRFATWLRSPKNCQRRAQAAIRAHAEPFCVMTIEHSFSTGSVSVSACRFYRSGVSGSGRCWSARTRSIR